MKGKFLFVFSVAGAVLAIAAVSLAVAGVFDFRGGDENRYLNGMFDQVLIMTVNPGFGGQKFIPEMLEKIRDTRKLLDEIGSEAVIQVDGGIEASTVATAYAAGARDFVAGTAIFGYPGGIKAGIKTLQEALF